MRSKILVWMVLLLTTLPILWPFLRPGFFPTHDGEWAIVRLSEMHRELKEGQFPPRWSGYLNHGYGYPLFLYTYTLPYYVAEIFYLIGFGLTTSIKIVFILSVLGSAITMFIFAKHLWGTWAGILSAVVYLYAPYRMINLFVRGSIGESLAFIFYPLLLWLISKFEKKHTYRLVVFTTLTVAAFLLTHNASVVLFAPILTIWALFVWHILDKSAKLNLVLSLGFGIAISAHFWLPAVLEKKYIALSLTPLANKTSHFLSVRDLFLGKWYFGIQPPLIIGLPLLFLGIVGTIFLLKHKKGELKKFGLVFGGLVAFSIFMVLSVSNPLWQFPLLKEIDFPWRMLSVASFLLAVLTGVIALKAKTNFIRVLIILLVIVLNMRYIQTQARMMKPDEFYATNDATTTSADELMPIWVENKPKFRPELPYRPQTLSTKVSVEKETATRIELLADTQGTDLILNKIYFPGWKAFVDNQEVVIEKLDHIGLMGISMPLGQHQVRVSFTRTWVRVVADVLSAFGAGVLVLYLWKNLSKSRS